MHYHVWAKKDKDLICAECFINYSNGKCPALCSRIPYQLDFKVNEKSLVVKWFGETCVGETINPINIMDYGQSFNVVIKASKLSIRRYDAQTRRFTEFKIRFQEPICRNCLSIMENSTSSFGRVHEEYEYCDPCWNKFLFESEVGK